MGLPDEGVRIIIFISCEFSFNNHIKQTQDKQTIDMTNTRKIDQNATTAVDETLVLDQGKISPVFDPIEFQKTLEIKQYSEVDFYGKTTPLGEGGAGIVLKGHDNNLGRDVAIKIIRPEMRKKCNALKRFIREARATAQIEHPNIVPVHEMGIHSEWGLYFTMKKLAGEDFRSILSKLEKGNAEYQNKYSLSRLLNIFTEVCNGVAYAHSKGVIHRDLKPENIFVGDFGEVLILDWGLVRKITLKDVADKSDNDTDGEIKIDIDASMDPSLTMEGYISGTPYYMSPEQIKGENNNIDHRSDIYTLGVILYQILTLKLPFAENNVKHLMAGIVNGRFHPPRKAGSKRKIPIELEAICLRAMSSQPENRYQHVKDLLNDIYNYFDHFPVSVMKHSLFSRLGKLCLRHKIISAFLITFIIGLSLHKGTVYIKYNVLYNSACQHIEKSISELHNANELLIASNKLRQTKVTPEKEQQSNKLDARCLQAENRAEDNAKLAIAMLDAIPEQFKNTSKVQKTYIQMLKKQIKYYIKTKNSTKAEKWLKKLEEILAKNKRISETDKKRQIKKMHAQIKK